MYYDKSFITGPNIEAPIETNLLTVVFVYDVT